MATVDEQAGRATPDEVAAARAVLDGTAHTGPLPVAELTVEGLADDLQQALEGARDRLLRLQAWAEPALHDPRAGAVLEAARPA